MPRQESSTVHSSIGLRALLYHILFYRYKSRVKFVHFQQHTETSVLQNLQDFAGVCSTRKHLWFRMSQHMRALYCEVRIHAGVSWYLKWVFQPSTDIAYLYCVKDRKNLILNELNDEILPVNMVSLYPGIRYKIQAVNFEHHLDSPKRTYHLDILSDSKFLT
jgi:hypothetical protein